MTREAAFARSFLGPSDCWAAWHAVVAVTRYQDSISTEAAKRLGHVAYGPK